MDTAAETNFQDRLMALGATRTVYSFYYPEVRDLVEEVWLSKPHFLYEKPYLKRVAGLHHEFSDEWREWVRPVVKLDSKEFPHYYPTAGSSEAIRDAIAHLGKTEGRIHVFRGEYEGYRAYANAFGVSVVDHERSNYAETLSKNSIRPGDWFFLSEPSSLDGNQWNGFDSFLSYVEALTPRLSLALDLCYVGSCAKLSPIRVSSPVIRKIFFSLSKTYGVYFHRIGGVFSKDPSASLVGNEYFRNNFSLHLGKTLLAKFSVFDLPIRYRPKQLEVMSILGDHVRGLDPADVVLLASRPVRNGEATELETYLSRNSYVRVCLTPGLDKVVGR
jgi:hypothetical protein